MDRSRQKTIGVKLWLLSTGLVFTIIIVGGLSMWTSAKLIRQLIEATDVQLPAVRNMTLADMMHDGIRANIFNAIIVSGSEDENEIDAVRAEGEEFKKNIEDYIHALEALNLQPAVRDAIAPVLPELVKYKASADALRTIALDGHVEEAIAKLPDFQKSFEDLEARLEKLGDLIVLNAEESGKRSREMATVNAKANVLVVVVGTFLGMLFSWILIRNLQKALADIIDRLNQESKTVTDSAQGLSVSAEKLSASTIQQAGALQETAASVDQITAMVNKTSDNAKSLESAAEESQDSASRGQDAISEMLGAMEAIRESNFKINSQVDEGNRKIMEIVEVIGEIGTKTKIINDIVFQTKLLSFNASVEAARAGEHGKGFAVVAEEVGNLAQMSGNAAKEISDMLSSSVRRVEEIVASNKKHVEILMSEGKSKISAGANVAKQCGEALHEIVRYSSHVKSMISEITKAIDEQNQGIKEISRAVQLLDQSTHENATTSQETSQTSAGLLNQAQSLGKIVNSLEQMVHRDAGKGSGEDNEETGPRGLRDSESSDHEAEYTDGSYRAGKRAKNNLSRLVDLKAVKEGS